MSGRSRPSPDGCRSGPRSGVCVSFLNVYFSGFEISSTLKPHRAPWGKSHPVEILNM